MRRAISLSVILLLIDLAVAHHLGLFQEVRDASCDQFCRNPFARGRYLR